MKRISLAVMSGTTAAVLALGVAAATAVPMGFTQDRSAELAKQINPAKPKSVILIIGDGMDDSMITAARNYSKGADGRFVLDELPFTGAMTTYGLKVAPGPDYPIAYVSDSAPTASGWSTGKKTVDGRVSQGPSTANEVPGVDYPTVLEKFKEAGKLTGNVSTAEITDATPAAAASHINQRACQGPANMATCPTALKSAGGSGSIAEQLVDNEVDVLLGGGLGRFSQPLEGSADTVLDYARDDKGYRYVANATELDAVTSLTGGPVLGLFAGANMTPKYQPLLATPAPGAGSPTTRCQNADRGTQPDLSTMTEKAIELLDNPAGFFLQTESAMIDKQEHAMDICGAIGDLEEIDETVQVALDYQKTNPDTLVIVTGDHSHSTQIVGSVNDGRQTATVQSADGDPLMVAYSTNLGGSNHTGSQIRVAASGPQAANVTGTIDQTDLFATMLGRTPSTLPSTGPTPPPVTVTASPTAAPTVTVTSSPTAQPTPSTPGVPSTTTPGRSRPTVKIASVKKISRGAGTSVAVAAVDADSVKVVVRQGKKKLVTDKLSAGGGSITLPGLAKGAVKIVVTARGDGGTTRKNRTIQVR